MIRRLIAAAVLAVTAMTGGTLAGAAASNSAPHAAISKSYEVATLFCDHGISTDYYVYLRFALHEWTDHVTHMHPHGATWINEVRFLHHQSDGWRVIDHVSRPCH